MRSMDLCPDCNAGVLVAYSTKRLAGSRFSKRYLRCDAGCGYRGAEVVPKARRRPFTSVGNKTPKTTLPQAENAGTMTVEVAAPPEQNQ